MRTNRKNELLNDMLMQYECRENTFPVIDDKGNFMVPVLSKHGIVLRYDKKQVPDKGFRGLVLEINDHGNISVNMFYKNGKTKEIASRV